MTLNFLKSAVTAACLVVASLGAAVAGDFGPLKIGTEGAYPPFNYVDTDGTIKGFDVEIGLALCEKIGAKCEVVAQDWDGIIPALLAKKYDMIIASMFITEERKKVVDFTQPYYKAAMTHVVAKDSPLTEFSDKALAGKTIGAQGGTTQAEFAEKMYPSATLKTYPTQDEVNLDLAAGRLDLQVGDFLPMFDWVHKDAGACCKMAGEPITDPAFVGDGVGIAVRKEDAKLREALNKAIAEVVADGTYKKINDKYFKIDLYTLK
jgi:polar amino acid transport system substrate-binding protein